MVNVGIAENPHFVQFFDTDRSLVDSIARFVVSGLMNDAGVLVIATPDHMSAVEGLLSRRGLDVIKLKDAGQINFLDAGQTLSQLLRNGQPDQELFSKVIGKEVWSLADRWQRVHAYGEMVGLLWKEGNAAGTIALEKLWNDLARYHSFTLFCGYSLHAFDKGSDQRAYDEICRSHSHVLPEDGPIQIGSHEDQLRALALLQKQAFDLREELKRREKAEAELRDFFENSVVPFHWVGPDGTILRANRAELDLLGYSESEYVGRPIAEFHADSDVIRNILRCLGQGQAIQSYPARLRCKDGSIRHVLIDSNVYFEDGKFIHTRCFTRDITKQVEAEASLREAEILKHLIIENSRDCIKVLDLDGRLIFMNRGGAEVTEICDPAAAQGAGWLDFWEGDVRTQAAEAFDAARAGEVREFVAFAPTAKTKAPKWWKIALSPILDSQGEITRILCVSHDITAHVQAQEAARELETRKQEEKFRLLVQSVKDYAIFMLDPEGRVVTWNEGAKRIKGYEAGEILGRHFSQFYTAEDIARDHPRHELELAVRDGVYEEEGWRIRKDGSRFWANVVITATRDEGGKLVGFSKVTRDLTERKRAEDELRRTRERFEEQARTFDTALSSSPDFHYILDTNHRFTYVNQSLLKLWNLTLDQVVGKTFEELGYPAELVKLHESQLNEALKGKTVRGENEYTSPGGSTGYYEYVFVPVLDCDRKVQAISGTSRDVTEAKRLEKARLEEQRQTSILDQVKQSEKMLDQIFQESPSFMAVLSGPEFIYTKANRKYYELTEMDEDMLLGKKVRDVLPELAEQGFVALLDEAYRTGKGFGGNEVPCKVTTGKGRKKDYVFDFVYQPVLAVDGRVSAIVAHGYDVTEKVSARRAIETERQNFRNLFKQTPEMVCILKGPDHVFEFVNEAHIRVLGFDATGRPVREAQPESVEVHGILDEVYRTGKTAELHEIPVTVTDRLRYFNLTYAARRDESGNINGVMVLGVEVTDQVQMREKLKDAVQSRDIFMSIASHELKTPLTSLKLQAQMRNRDIKRGNLAKFSAERLPQLIADDEKQIDRLTMLVNDMLDISRIQSGKLSLSPEEFDLNDLVQEALSRFSAQIEASKSTVSFVEGRPAPGRWDRFRVEQVFVNLLTNALKYGGGSPIEIRICADGRRAALAVRDGGIGIKMEDQKRIFGQFERAVSESSVSGLGLGLYISKMIVEAHQGQISVQSEVGRGSTFTVELPLAAPSMPGLSVQAPAPRVEETVKR